MNWIVQQPNEGSCAGCVAASITGTTLEDVYEFMGHRWLPFDRQRILDYLASHGFAIGYHINSIIPQRDESGKITAYKIDVPMFQKAYVVATPPNTSYSNHACYWDGKNFWDPHYREPVDNLHEYRIWSWTPLYSLCIGPPVPLPPPPERSDEDKGFKVSPTGSVVLIAGTRRDEGYPGPPYAVTGVME